MNSPKDEADTYGSGGERESLIRRFAAVAAKEARIVQLHGEGAKQEDLLDVDCVVRLLEGGDVATRNGLLQLDRCYRHRVCGLLRHRYPEFASNDLLGIWQLTLLTIVRQARRHRLDRKALSVESVWSIAHRCAQRMQRRRRGRLSGFEQAVSDRELGKMWTMLTDLQREEVLGLVSDTADQFTDSMQAAWQQLSDLFIERAVKSEVAGVEGALHEMENLRRDSATAAALLGGRKLVLSHLKEHGYDLLGGDDDDGDGGGEGERFERRRGLNFEEATASDDALERLVSEAMRTPSSSNRVSPLEFGGSERYLTAADRRALDTSASELSEMILFQDRSLPRPETALCSRRHASIDTRLQATTRFLPHESEPDERRAIRDYDEILREKRLEWAPDYEFVALLGEGGQGAVYMVRCPGSDGFENLLALKIFDPRYSAGRYAKDTRAMARMARLVASIHHPNVLDVIDFRQQQGVRMMLMEWIDGYDLGRLLVPAMLKRLERQVDAKRWGYLTDVVVKSGPDGPEDAGDPNDPNYLENPRLRPGVAVAILRHCLAALQELHCRGVVHGDIKPWNIMLSTNGFAKLIDIGSAFPWQEATAPTHWTPWYVAPEVMEGRPYTPLSDLASLGYVLIELLSGRSLFRHLKPEQVLAAKRTLPMRLADAGDQLLPSGVKSDPHLIALCRRLIEPIPDNRFATAREADLDKACGAYKYLEALSTNRLAVAWEVEIRDWLGLLG